MSPVPAVVCPLHEAACETKPREQGQKKACAAAYAQHTCALDWDDLEHFPEQWDGDWLLGVTHRCACKPNPVEWPEVR